jgi:hypothetical protein
VTAWLKLALGLVALVQWIMTRLDEAERRRVVAAMLTKEVEDYARSEIERVAAVRDAVERGARAAPGGVLDPHDPNLRD